MGFDVKRKHSIISGSSVACFYQDGIYYTGTGQAVPDEIAALPSAEGQVALDNYLKTKPRGIASTVTASKAATVNSANGNKGDPEPASAATTPAQPAQGAGYNGPEGDEPGVDPEAEKPLAPSGKDDPEQREVMANELRPQPYASLKKMALAAGMSEDDVPTGEGAKDKLIEWLLNNTEY